MTVTPVPPEGYPTRRSLRERAAGEAENPSIEAATDPAQVEQAPSRVLSETQPDLPDQKPGETSVAQENSQESELSEANDPIRLSSYLPAPEPSSLGFATLPLREHVPAVSIETAETAPPVKAGLKRIARFGAAACAGGLLLAFALPFAGQSAEAEEVAAASQQRLFSEISPDEIPDSLASIEAVVSDDSAPQLFSFRPYALVNYPFDIPVLLTDPFGYRSAPVAGFHDAQDFGAAAGTPIKVIADGIVTEAGQTTDGCGFGLKVEHEIDGQNVTSRYCHMLNDSHSLSVGDTVKMGDHAGAVGETGLAFGAHLHMALRVNDEPADPMAFIAKYHRVNRPA